MLEDKHFQGLSVTSERWLPLGEVRSWGEGGREGGGGGGGEGERGGRSEDWGRREER